MSECDKHSVSDGQGNDDDFEDSQEDYDSAHDSDHGNDDSPLFDPSRVRLNWQPNLPARYSRNCDAPAVPGAENNWKIYRNLPILDAAVGVEQGPWFRLVQISPGSYEEQIRCNLIRRPIFDARYDALSYAWGTEPCFNELLLFGRDETPFHVSKHLIQALRRLRQPETVVTIWIDMICIDQQNSVERAAQVERMSDIFSWAENVRIWLGDAEPPRIDDTAFFLRLCQASSVWWHRLWVIQECAFAKKCPVVMLGSYSTDLSALLERWEVAVRSCRGSAYMDMHRILQTAFHELKSLLQMWQIQTENTVRSSSLLSLLRATRSHNCSDSHDVIYALLSLMDEREARQIPPDYRRPLHHLIDQVELMVRTCDHWNGSSDEQLLQELKTLLQNDQISSLLRTCRLSFPQRRTTYLLRSLKSSACLPGQIPDLLEELRTSLSQIELQYVLWKCGITGYSLRSRDLTLSTPPEFDSGESSSIIRPDITNETAPRTAYTPGVAAHMCDAHETDHPSNKSNYPSDDCLRFVAAVTESILKGRLDVFEAAVSGSAFASENFTLPDNVIDLVLQCKDFAFTTILYNALSDIYTLERIFARLELITDLDHYRRCASYMICNGLAGTLVGTELGGILRSVCQKGDISTVELLLDRGAATNQPPNKYEGAAIAAAIGGHISVLEVLCGYGADLNSSANGWSSALSAACETGSLIAMEYLLEKRPLQHNDRNPEWWYYDHAYCAARANAKREKGALRVRDPANSAAIYQAVIHHKSPAAIISSEHIRDIDRVVGDLGNALQAAAFLGQMETVVLLLDRGANIDAEGGKLGRALNAATLAGNTTIVKRLLHHGVRRESPESSFGNAPQTAKRRGYTELAHLLNAWLA